MKEAGCGRAMGGGRPGRCSVCRAVLKKGQGHAPLGPRTSGDRWLRYCAACWEGLEVRAATCGLTRDAWLAERFGARSSSRRPLPA